MTGQRAAREPYATRFETEVTAVDGDCVWLETSYFYGASGGQPADRGTIGGLEVADVRLVDGEQRHVLAEEPSFRQGHRALCSVEWAFRMYCMRAHTASHILAGAVRRTLGEGTVAGLEIGPEVVGLDLETEPVDEATLIELDELVTRVVWESRSVSWEAIPVSRAREHERICVDEREVDAFEGDRVRVVTIGANDTNSAGTTTSSAHGQWDVSVCGGTHVRNTREVGPVTVLGQSSLEDGLTRVELAVGPNAIERRTAEKRVAFATARTLGVGLGDVPDELDRLR
ncbi:alanyl-tRNA editing protein [Natronorubrum bangense]|uniref:alanine--tRNA ligase n=2 Tax=Natronorubrum bangense TaxID=61858 RepID=L9WRG7_9EURY|nr:alanyl-tRNA editing protein [Natronorubrum bangense]ELY51816.1 threonyl/alanyl tRNA synthetase SAD [Natronorubrum bangense JCM 10635]QCC54949.1 alanyl-tRNA editing protein [Natronorubrum bangense]